MTRLDTSGGSPDGLLWTNKPEDVVQDWSLLPGKDHWLFAYARAVCVAMTFAGHKTKGKHHDHRFEVRNDLFEMMLPHFHIHPPSGLKDDGHRRAKGQKASATLQFGRVRCALEAHRELLGDHLLAAGYDMERGRLVCEDAYLVAKAHWMLNAAPMTGALLNQQLSAVRTKLRALDRAEDAHLFRQLES